MKSIVKTIKTYNVENPTDQQLLNGTENGFVVITQNGADRTTSLLKSITVDDMERFNIEE